MSSSVNDGINCSMASLKSSVLTKTGNEGFSPEKKKIAHTFIRQVIN